MSITSVLRHIVNTKEEVTLNTAFAEAVYRRYGQVGPDSYRQALKDAAYASGVRLCAYRGWFDASEDASRICTSLTQLIRGLQKGIPEASSPSMGQIDIIAKSIYG